MNKYVKWGGFVAVVALIAGGTVWSNQSDKPESQSQTASTSSTTERPVKPVANYQAPDFTLTDMSGNQVQLSSLKGKPVFLNFWASWCPPCKAEMPDLVKMSEKYKDQIAFYGVNLTPQDSEVNAKGFVETYKIGFPTLMDVNGEVSTQYRVLSIPTSITVDENGVIAHRIEGQLSENAMEEIFFKLSGR